jgi:hypothetical protein
VGFGISILNGPSALRSAMDAIERVCVGTAAINFIGLIGAALMLLAQ